jgi:hypothetical protein
MSSAHTIFIPDNELERVYERFLHRMDSQKKELDEYLRRLQRSYVRSLSEGFLQALIFYGNRGDSIVNNYLRTRALTTNNLKYIRETYAIYSNYFANKDTDFFRLLEGFKSPDPNIVSQSIESIAYMIQWIIEGAPRASKSFYVARGAVSEYMESSNSFLSTSIDADVAQSFSTSESPQCADASYEFIKSIKLSKKTPFLYMRCLADTLIEKGIMPELPRFVKADEGDYSQIINEYEVLLPPKVEIYPVKTYLNKKDKSFVTQTVRGKRKRSPMPHSIAFNYGICGFYLYECKELGDTNPRSLHSLRTRRSKGKKAAAAKGTRKKLTHH